MWAPSENLKDAGGAGEALLRGQLGGGDPALPVEQRWLPPLRSWAPPAVQVGTGLPSIQTEEGLPESQAWAPGCPLQTRHHCVFTGL